MDPRLLRHYESELRFVREMGAEFAREYPKIAGRLALANTEVADPYVERLLEGFAFLTARIQLKLEAEFPTFTQSLLQMVYPHYLAPTPAMAVVQFNPDQAVRGMSAGMELPRGTVLRSILGADDDTNCEFRTAQPVQLLPIEIAEAEYLPAAAAVSALNLPEAVRSRGAKAAIRLRLKAMGSAPFAEIALSRLPLFLAGAESTRFRLHEQLVADLQGIVVRPTQRPLPWQEVLPKSALEAQGFEDDESLLPPTPLTFQGYRLLQEYFAMPERFLSVRLNGLDSAVSRCAGQELDIIFLLSRSDMLLANGFGADQFRLFCTPAINLFPKRGDRLNLSEREVEHQIVPDRMRPVDFEVFSVQGVEGFAADGGEPQDFLPFYAANDLTSYPEMRRYYSLRRRPRQLSARSRQRGPRSSYIGHEVYISLVDAEQAPFKGEMRQLGFDLLCTNRDLPLFMPVGKGRTDFTLEASAPVASIRCLVGPTAPRPCRSDGEYAWRFISHLGLNYLSLVDSDSLHGAVALRELLGLYVPSASSHQARQLEGLLSTSTRPVVRRIPGAGPLTAGRGLEITLKMDEVAFGGAGAVVLAAVLDRFFAKYVSINAFTETVLTTAERGEVARWPIRIGRQPAL
ncbi:type VI secretion system baseplate subunit TssF [Siccirubricoccus phaeus]|uniref:type VI secretion system baseplate subunit TssF n=1 Tax=Siccirubricoccus phaeus TaxID=2595053 RepID=UPI0011F2971F|nr:type VI secretion system baseplate subunit TssF [Siccirubricoccus phaeus]